MTCLFILLRVTLRKIFFLMKSNLPTFGLFLLELYLGIFAYPKSQRVSPMFPPRSFIVLSFVFSPVIFWVLFIWDKDQSLIIACGCLVGTAPYVEKCIISPLHSCYQSGVHTCVGPFLGSLFCSLYLFV